MILTPQIVLRIALLVVCAVILQVSFFAQLPLLGSVANLIPVAIVALGLLGGAVQGAVVGFAAGLLVDSLIGGTLGVSALALMAVGYLAGRWRETYDIVSSLVPPLLSGALSGVAAAAYAILTLMLGVDAAVSILFLREIIVQALLGGLLGIAVFPLVRASLRPALIDEGDRRRVRRRALRRARRGRRSLRPLRSPSWGPEGGL